MTRRARRRWHRMRIVGLWLGCTLCGLIAAAFVIHVLAGFIHVGHDLATCPLYAPFAAVAIATLALWWFGRPPRIRPGHCPCGYDLRGNVSGVCPECGKKATHADA